MQDKYENIVITILLIIVCRFHWLGRSLLLLFFASTMLFADAKYELHISQGYVIEQLGDDLCIQTTTAKLHFLLQLPILPNNSAEAEFNCSQATDGSRSQISACRQARPLLGSFHYLKTTMAQTSKTELSRILEMLKTFEHERASNNTRKRGLLDPVGSFLGKIYRITD